MSDEIPHFTIEEISRTMVKLPKIGNQSPGTIHYIRVDIDFEGYPKQKDLAKPIPKRHEPIAFQIIEGKRRKTWRLITPIHLEQ